MSMFLTLYLEISSILADLQQYTCFCKLWESLVAIDIGGHRSHVELPELFFLTHSTF